MNLSAERNGSRKTERQSRKTPNQTVDNSNCHTQTRTHMTRLRASPFQNKPRTHDFPCAAPSSGQDVSFAGLQTTEGSRSQPLSGFFYPADRLIGFRDVGSRFAIWVLVKWRNTNHTSLLASTLRLEGPALRKCNTKHAKPSKQGKLTKSRRSKPKIPRTNRVVDWWKTKTGIAKDENKTWKHTRTVATSHA